MMGILLARKDIGDLLQDEEYLVVVGILIATLLVGAMILAYVQRWRKRQFADDDRCEIHEVGSYRAMYERGELSKEEYDRVRLRVAKRVKEKVAPKATSAKPDEPPSQEPQTTPPPP